jgi:hypothetical protein
MTQEPISAPEHAEVDGARKRHSLRATGVAVAVMIIAAAAIVVLRRITLKNDHAPMS